ncbi:MAG: TatD family hydrolase [Bacteroidaceae bacterium]|nr:TatD family hydrolase [Bacteroidaceae bacterium]
MRFIDTHTHPFVEEFDADRSAVIERALAADVRALLLPNIDLSTVEPLLLLCKQYPKHCFPMMGLHPTSVGEDYVAVLDKMVSLLDCSTSYVGIGEIGMDLYWDKQFCKQQADAFEKQLQWSIAYQLPVSIHSRAAVQEIDAVMKRYMDTPIKGVFHCFSGNLEEAALLLKYPNFKLGINGVATFKNAGLAEVLPAIPLEKLVLETDAPYLSPVPFRGKRNESSYLPYILKRIAAIYHKEEEEVASVIWNNTLAVFSLEHLAGSL